MLFHIKVPHTAHAMNKYNKIHAAKDLMQGLIARGYIQSPDDASLTTSSDGSIVINFSGNGNQRPFRHLNGHAQEGRNGGMPQWVDLKILMRQNSSHVKYSQKGDWYIKVPVHRRTQALFHPHKPTKLKSIHYKTIGANSRTPWIVALPSDMLTGNPNHPFKRSDDYDNTDTDTKFQKKTKIANDINVSPNDVSVGNNADADNGQAPQQLSLFSQNDSDEENEDSNEEQEPRHYQQMSLDLSGRQKPEQTHYEQTSLNLSGHSEPTHYQQTSLDLSNHHRPTHFQQTSLHFNDTPDRGD